MKKLTALASSIAMFVLLISNSHCSKSSNNTPAGPVYRVQLMTSVTLGKYLTDKNGDALYFFSNDVAGKSTCTGGCEATWPLFQDSTIATNNLGAGLNMSDFSTIKTSEGKTQVTYKGWPLYYFSPNGVQEPTGQTGGDGVGGIWFVAKADYTFMVANTQWVGGDGNDYTGTYPTGQYLPTYTKGTGMSLYITDALGATLYTFYHDSANTNKFTKPDFSNNPSWPICDTTINIVVPSTLNKSLFSTIAVDGNNQWTYNGWPLYFYGKDSLQRGVTRGVSVGQPSVTAWPAATPNMPAAPHK